MNSELNPATTTPDTANTDNTRLSLLDSTIGEALAFRIFKNTAATLGHPIQNDSDLEALEAAAAAFFGAPFTVEELDPTFASSKTFSWTFWTTLLSLGRLNWWKEADDKTPIVDLPTEDGTGYFAEESRYPFDEGGDL